MRKTTEQKLKEQEDLFIEKEKVFLEDMEKSRREISNLEERISIRDKNVQNLQQEINRLNENFETVFAPETIKEGVQSLSQIMHGIKCEITKREVFKEFVLGMVKSVKYQNLEAEKSLDYAKQEYIRNNNEYLKFAEVLRSSL